MNLLTFTRSLLLTCFLFLSSIATNAQDAEWFEYEMDSIVLKFPSEDVRLFDTINEGIKLKQLYTTVGTSTYILQKLPLDNSHVSISQQLPSDHESLIKYYEGVSRGTVKGIGAETVKAEEIKFGHLIGYKSIFYDSDEKPFYEMHTFIIGNDLINICYYDKVKKNNVSQNRFFDSLDFDLLEPVSQFVEEDKAYALGYKAGYLFAQFSIYIIMALATIALIWFIARKKKKKPLQ
ncbi:hypothetical protein FLAN108750_00465 [Flavobacterium antarcticum]